MLMFGIKASMNSWSIPDPNGVIPFYKFTISVIKQLTFAQKLTSIASLACLARSETKNNE